MFIRAAIILTAAVMSSRPASAAAPESPHDSHDVNGVALFDGETLDGWQATGEAKWEIVDGTICTAGTKPGFLMTTGEFSDFELHVEFRAPAATNSGVFLRTPLEPTNPAKDCYELNIAPPENPFPTGCLVARRKTTLPATEFPTPDEWHSLDVTAKGGKFTARLDGRAILKYDDPAPIRRGHIGLQSNQGEVAFRNICIRKLPR